MGGDPNPRKGVQIHQMIWTDGGSVSASGFEPGLIPPVGGPFSRAEGAILCVQIR